MWGVLYDLNDLLFFLTQLTVRHNIRGVKFTPASRRRYKIGLPVEGLSYSAVKLFSKYSNLCDHGT